MKRSKSTASARLVAWILALVGTPITFLIMAGYGVALSVESVFGMPRAQVFSSPQDLIELSSVFIAQSIISLGEGLANFLYPKHLFDVYMPQTLTVLGVVLLFVCVRVFDPPSWWPELRSRLGPYFGCLTKQKVVRAILGYLFGALVVIASVPIAGMLLPALVLGILVAIALVPVWALQMGTVFLDRHVVSPSTCLSQVRAPSLAEMNRSTDGALCARVVTSHGSHSGRVVAATSDGIVLWDGQFGVRKVDTRGQLVEVVSEEDCDCAKHSRKLERPVEHDGKP